MSRENVEIVRRGFEAWVHGDMHEVGAMLAPDVRWEGARDSDKACRGSEEVLRFVRLGRKKGPSWRSRNSSTGAKSSSSVSDVK